MKLTRLEWEMLTAIQKIERKVQTTFSALDYLECREAPISLEGSRSMTDLVDSTIAQLRGLERALMYYPDFEEGT